MERELAAGRKGALGQTLVIPQALKAVTLLAAMSLVYYSTLAGMVHTWRSSEAYSHGFLIPVISGFLVWRKRKVLRAAVADSDPFGFLLLLGGVVLLLAGTLAFEAFTIRVSMLAVVAGLILVVMGRHIFAELAFPLAYLFFMIPLPHIIMKSIAVGLKYTYAKLTYFVVSSTGVPIVMEGVNLQLPNASLVVGDYCTGVLSIVAISAIAVVYAYLTHLSVPAKVLLVALAVPMALLGNMLRLASTVMLTYYLGTKVLDSAIHQFHGMFNFLITISMLVLVGKGLAVVEGRVGKGVPREEK